MTKKTYVSPSKAAALLDVHRNTVYTWAKNARLSNVKIHPVTGYISIPIKEIEKIKKKAK